MSLRGKMFMWPVSGIAPALGLHLLLLFPSWRKKFKCLLFRKPSPPPSVPSAPLPSLLFLHVFSHLLFAMFLGCSTPHITFLRAGTLSCSLPQFSTQHSAQHEVGAQEL